MTTEHATYTPGPELCPCGADPLCGCECHDGIEVSWHLRPERPICCGPKCAAPALLAALEAIAGMVVNDDTDYRQLAAICIGTARVALTQARADAR